MRPDHFRAACALLWGKVGDPWGHAGVMAFLPVNERNAKYMATGGKEVGPDIEARIMAEVKRGLAGEISTPCLEVVRQALTESPDTPS